MPKPHADDAAHEAARRRREALERAAAKHPDLPDDVVDTQVGKADFGAALLGGDPELTETAVVALEHNLERYESAVDDGATPVTEDD